MIPSSNDKTLGGLLQRKPCWVPSRRGWLLLLSGVGVLTAIAFFALHPFLAVNAPVPSRALVVEGWIEDFGLERAARDCATNSCERIFTTGGPLPKGSFLCEYHTHAQVAAATLARLGVNSNLLFAVPAPAVQRERTLQSAVALRQWCVDHHVPLRDLNVLTIGPHARRTWFLYRRVFGPEVAVGVISIDSEEYDPRRWWASSAGIRTVLGETVAYCHDLLFAHPPDPEPAQPSQASPTQSDQIKPNQTTPTRSTATPSGHQ